MPKTVEEERRDRIRLAVAAYAYEFMNDPTMSDGDFDKLALTIDTNIDTGHSVLDKFFKEEFSPSTGVWIHRHPELDRVKQAYLRLRAMEDFK